MIWETIGGSVLETLFKHLSIGGRLIIVGGITGYKTVGFPDVSIPNLPTKVSHSNFVLKEWLNLIAIDQKLFFHFIAFDEISVFDWLQI